MSHTITVRLTKDLAVWLEDAAGRAGVPQCQIVREQLEKAKAKGGGRLFMRLVGKVRGPKILSQRKGFTLAWKASPSGATKKSPSLKPS